MDLNISELRRQLLTLLDDLPEEGVVVTRRGKPLARIVPIAAQRRGRYVTGPLLKGKGAPGPLCPTTANPYDILFD